MDPLLSSFFLPVCHFLSLSLSVVNSTREWAAVCVFVCLCVCEIICIYKGRGRVFLACLVCLSLLSQY